MVVADNKLFIKSRDLLKFFNASDGKFLGNLASIGEGPGEYLFVNRLWNTDDTIHIFDSMSKKNQQLQFVGTISVIPHLI